MNSIEKSGRSLAGKSQENKAWRAVIVLTLAGMVALRLSGVAGNEVCGPPLLCLLLAVSCAAKTGE